MAISWSSIQKRIKRHFVDVKWFLHMQGGEGTREEMCFAFLNYYPYLAEDLVVCGSIPTPDSFVPFLVNDIP